MEGLAGRLPRLVFLRRCELGADVDDEVTYQDDIVLQLRRAAVWTILNDQREMLNHAADEIERLRLTAAEREALEYVEFSLRCESHPVCRQHTDTLRGLLKRMGWWSHSTPD